MKIRLEDRLPFVTVKLGQGRAELLLERVLLDTGSAATVFAVDEIATLGIVPEPTDRIRRVVGVAPRTFPSLYAIKGWATMQPAVERCWAGAWSRPSFCARWLGRASGFHR